MTPATPEHAPRETFASRFGTLMTIVGVAIGLGNVWRFPYMVGKFGGAAFVLFYALVSIVIGVPALMAEFALGRHTRRGPVGAFEAAACRSAAWSAGSSSSSSPPRPATTRR